MALELAEKLVSMVSESGDCPVVVDGRNGFGFQISVSPNMVVDSEQTGSRAIHVIYREGVKE